MGLENEVRRLRPMVNQLEFENENYKKNTLNEERIREMSKSMFIGGDEGAKLGRLKKTNENLKKENELLKKEMSALKSIAKTGGGASGGQGDSVENAQLKSENFELKKKMMQLEENLDSGNNAGWDQGKIDRIVKENEKLRTELEILRETGFNSIVGGTQYERDTKELIDELRTAEESRARLERDLGKAEMKIGELTKKANQNSQSGSRGMGGMGGDAGMEGAVRELVIFEL